MNKAVRGARLTHVGAFQSAPERLHRLVQRALVEFGPGVASDQYEAPFLRRLTVSAAPLSRLSRRATLQYAEC